MEQIANRQTLVADTIRTLKPGKKYARSIGVILLAPPGAGKWELATKLEQELGLVHIQVDALQHYLAPKIGFFDNANHVADFALEVMVELAGQGYSSVIDRNINKKGFREKFRLDLEAAGATLVEI